MANKTFTAHDLRMGKLEITRGKNEDGEDILTLVRDIALLMIQDTM